MASCVVFEVMAATRVGCGDLGNFGIREYCMVVIDEATRSIEPSTLVNIPPPPPLGHLH